MWLFVKFRPPQLIRCVRAARRVGRFDWHASTFETCRPKKGWTNTYCSYFKCMYLFLLGVVFLQRQRRGIVPSNGSSVHPPSYLSILPSVHPCILSSFHLSISPSFHPFSLQAMQTSVHLSVCPSIHTSRHPFANSQYIRVSVCLLAHLSICLFVYLSFYVSFYSCNQS